MSAEKTQELLGEDANSYRLFLEEKINWIWGYPDNPIYVAHMIPSLRNIATHRMVGDRFTGKSAKGEQITANYHFNGATCYDLHSANDNENLAIARSRFKDNLWLLHDDQVRIRSPFNTMKFSELDPRKVGDGKYFTTCHSFFPNEYRRYAALHKFTNLIRNRDSFNSVHVIFIREAQEYISSKTETNQVSTKKLAEDSFVKFHNQAFHCGYAVVLDSQREVEVAKNMRELGTFTYYKNMGAMEIPKRIWWIQSPDRANFDLDSLRYLTPDQFLIMTNRNAVGLGTFELPPWHIHRGEGIMGKLDIHPEKFVDGQWVEIKQIVEGGEPDTRRGRGASTGGANYKTVAERGLKDKRVKIDEKFEGRIIQLRGEGTSVRKITETLISEGCQCSVRAVEDRIASLKLKKLIA